MLPTRRSDDTPAVLDPFSEIERLRREMWSLIDGNLPFSGTPASNLALADLEESDDTFTLEVELPGVHKEDVDIELDGRRLVVTAERKGRERVGVLRRRTRRVGTFRHEVLLPGEVDDGAVEATLTDGILTVRLPKAESGKRRRIAVG